MTSKLDAANAVVDWDKVEKATEVPRTYLVRDHLGKEFFKMYKPSQAKTIFKTKGWTGKIISKLDRSRAGKRT